MHRVKIGAPTRELWIDGAWYSVFFDCRPVSIKIGSRSWDVFLEDGAAPIVDIGKVARKDLCLGIIIFEKKIVKWLHAKFSRMSLLLSIIDGAAVVLEYFDI